MEVMNRRNQAALVKIHSDVPTKDFAITPEDKTFRFELVNRFTDKYSNSFRLHNLVSFRTLPYSTNNKMVEDNCCSILN